MLKNILTFLLLLSYIHAKFIPEHDQIITYSDYVMIKGKFYCEHNPECAIAKINGSLVCSISYVLHDELGGRSIDLDIIMKHNFTEPAELVFVIKNIATISEYTKHLGKTRPILYCVVYNGQNYYVCDENNGCEAPVIINQKPELFENIILLYVFAFPFLFFVYFLIYFFNKKELLHTEILYASFLTAFLYLFMFKGFLFFMPSPLFEIYGLFILLSLTPFILKALNYFTQQKPL